jgi:hypothetical protein
MHDKCDEPNSRHILIANDAWFAFSGVALSNA